MLKFPFIVALSVAFAGPAIAMDHTVTLEQWSKRVEKAVDGHLRYPHFTGGRYDQGLVEVTFLCSDGGRPDKVAVSKSSGSRALDRAAVRAVEQVATLHPRAKGVHHDQVYKAQLLFGTHYSGDSNKAWRKQVADMQKGAADNNGWLKRRNDGAIATAIMLVPSASR